MRTEQVLELEDTLRGIMQANLNTVTGKPRHGNIHRMAEAALARSASYDKPQHDEEPDYAGGDAHHGCRYCHHALAKHNAIVGCKRCDCMGTPSECRPQTDAEFDAAVIA